MTVLDLFTQTFPNYKLDTSGIADLRDMPVDTVCGDACARAIKSAKPLLRHTALAYGSAGEHLKGNRIRDDLARAVLDICLCYICG